MHRRARLDRDRSLIVEQRFEGTAQATLATGSSWFVSWVHVESGRLAFWDGRGMRSTMAGSFVLYLPPRSLVRMPLDDVCAHTVGHSGVDAPPAWPDVPLAVPCEGSEHVELSVFEPHLCEADVNSCGIDADVGCSPRVVALRRALATSSLAPRAVGRASSSLGWSASGASRAFARAYGITARQYITRMRIHDAVTSLLRGAQVAEVAFSNGFNDLSAFYRQFRSTTGVTPGRYRRTVKKVQDSG